MLKVIDVSYANGNINWNVVKNNIDGTIIRCGFGMNITSQDDEKYKRNIEECIRLGIPFGVYLYSYANTIEKAQSEAEHVLRLIEPYKKYLKLHIWYDIENEIQAKLDKNLLTNIINTFCNKIEGNGYSVGIYANNNWLRNKIDKSLQDKYMIWSAGYGSNDGQVHEDAKYSHKNVVCWQYTSNGNIDGVGRCDVNYYYKDINTDIVENTTTETTENEKIDIFSDGLVNCIFDIQEWLNRKYGFNLVQDNIYGNETHKALVKALQIELNNQFKANLAIDGIFGTKTKNACISVREGAEGNITMLIQMALFIKGYSINMDKKFGSDTAQKVGQFQSDNGLSADKIVGKNTFEKLFK